MTKDDVLARNTAYSNAIKIMANSSSLNQVLCDVYDAIEVLPPIERIVPILKCLERLPPKLINDDALKTVQRLLITIANIGFDKTCAGRTTPYTEEVLCFVGQVLLSFPQLIERNNKSLTKIAECTLNHLLYLLVHKRTEEFELCRSVLSTLMQKIGLVRNGGKLLMSITQLLKPDFLNLAPDDIYFGYLQKQNKAPKNNAVIILWSLFSYLVENAGVDTKFSVPLQEFVTALKFSHESNVTAVQNACTHQLATLMRLGDSGIQRLFPEICAELNIMNDHPIILNAQRAVSAMSIDFGNKEGANHKLQELCNNAGELLSDARKLRMLNEFLANPNSGQPLPVEFATGVLFKHTLVINNKLSSEVAKELELCRKLCANLLQCRTILIGSLDQSENEVIVQQVVSKPKHKNKKQLPAASTQKRRSETPPLLITLDDSDDSSESQESKPPDAIPVKPSVKTPAKTPSKTPAKSVTTFSQLPTKFVPNKSKAKKQADEPKTKRQRQSSTSQIDYSQIYATESQLLQHEDSDGEENMGQDQATSSNQNAKMADSSSNDATLTRLFNAETPKTSTSALTNDDMENLADLF